MKLLTADELAIELRMSASWIRRHSKPEAKLRVPALKLGSSWRYDIERVKSWLEKLAAEGLPYDHGSRHTIAATKKE